MPEELGPLRDLIVTALAVMAVIIVVKLAAGNLGNGGVPGAVKRLVAVV